MFDLLDLYEREYFSDLHALTNLGKRISGNQDILINYTNTDLVYTTGGFINLPLKFKNDIRTSQGLVAHESGHIGYGSFELAFRDLIKVLSEKYEFPPGYIKILINMVEDVRIDAINKKKFPGFHENLKSLNQKLLPIIESKMERNRDLLTYIYLDMEDYKGYEEKPEFRGISFKDSDWSIVKNLKRLLLKALTPNTSIITCDQLCKILKNYIIFKRSKPVRYSNRPTYNKRARKPFFPERVRLEEFDCEENYYYRDDYEEGELSDFFEDSSVEGKIEQVIDEIPIITNSIAEFSEDKGTKSKLNETSNDMVEKIKDLDLKAEDIEQLIENIEDVGEQHDVRDVLADNDSLVSDSCNEIEKNEKRIEKEKGTLEKDHHNDEIIEDINDLIKEIEELCEDQKDNPIEAKSEEIIEKLDELSKKIDNSNLNEVLESEWESKKNEITKLINQIEKLEEEEDEKKKSEKKEEIIHELEDLVAQFDNITEEYQKIFKNKDVINSITEMIIEASQAMNERYLLLEEGEKDGKGRKVVEISIENDDMRPQGLKYSEIQNKYNNIIQKLKRIFCDLRNDSDLDTFQKAGRLNNKFIKTVTSNYKFKKCFTKNIRQKELKILVMVDISGSMEGKKIQSAKVAMVMLCEALKEIANFRIVLFTGEYDARNILVKDFDEIVNPSKFDKFGRHNHEGSNLDGISIKNEAMKLTKNEIIIVISDGQPAGSGYGLSEAIHEIHDVRKLFKVFAFSIDARGEHLNQLYGDNWILASSSNNTDLSEKLIMFCRLLVKEFYRQ